MTSTPRRLAVAAGLAVLLLSGCGDGRLQPGAAALVGSDRIATDDLQRRVEQVLVDPQAEQELGADRAGLQRLLLDRLVKRRLLAAAAAQRGVTVTDGDVADRYQLILAQNGTRAALEANAARSAISPQDLDAYLRDLVVAEALGASLVAGVEVPPEQLRAAYQQNLASYDRVRARHILLPSEAAARAVLAEVQRDPTRFAALAARSSTDAGSKDKGGDLGVAARGQFVPAFEEVLFSLPEGGFGLARTEFGFHVVNSVERQRTTLAQATPELRRGLLQQQTQAAAGELLTRTAADLGVTVNPRFGAWDPQTATVVAADDPNDVLVDPSPTAEPAGPDQDAPVDPDAPAPSPAG